jgi:hypothetical protein
MSCAWNRESVVNAKIKLRIKIQFYSTKLNFWNFYYTRLLFSYTESRKLSQSGEWLGVTRTGSDSSHGTDFSFLYHVQTGPRGPPSLLSAGCTCSFRRSKAVCSVQLNAYIIRCARDKNTYSCTPTHPHTLIALFSTLYILAVTLHTIKFNIKKFYVVPTLRLRVLYGSQNKQQLLPYKTLRD